MSKRVHLDKAALREYQHSLDEQQLSSAADRRIQAAMHKARAAQRSGSSGRVTWALAGAFALMLLLGGGLSLLSQQMPSQGTRMGGFLVVRGAVIFAPGAAHPENALQCETKRCRLRFTERRTRIQLQQRANILRVKQTLSLSLLRGVATFDVAPRPVGEPPLHIKVSHGIVEVVGTRFTIRQAQDHGELTLHHGRVRFLHKDGPAVEVKTGDTLRWPLRGVPTTRGARSPARPRTARALAPMPLRRVALLRPRPVLRVRGVSPRRRTLSPRGVLAGPTLARARSAAKRGRARSVRPTQRTTLSQPALDVGGVHAGGHPSAPPHSKPVVPRALPAPQRPKVLPAAAPRVQPVPRRKLIPRLAFSRWLQELSRLRSQTQFAQAAQALRKHLKALAQPPHAQGNHTIRERLHYELGMLLTHYLHKGQRACQHWRHHSRMFRCSNRYQQEVRALLLKCP